MDRARILTMSVQSIHASKRLVAPFASEGAVVGMQLLVAFAVMLSGEALATAGPLALEWAFLVVGPHMT
jgi:hypothetical protein